MVFITSVTYVFLMLVGATGIIMTTARTLFILELVAFVVVTAALAIHILLGGE